MGEAEGWKYMDGLHENIAQYTHSGSQALRRRPAAASSSIGISFEYRANREKAQGEPIDLVFPKEGLGWDLEAIGIMKSTKKLAAAKKLMDWAASDAAMALYAKNFAIVAVPGAVAAAAERSRRLREAPGEERLRLGGEEPRQDPRRVEQALRRRSPSRSKRSRDVDRTPSPLTRRGAGQLPIRATAAPPLNRP